MDSKSAGGRSIASNVLKSDDDVDDDSIAAYNEGETGKHSTKIGCDFLNWKCLLHLKIFMIFMLLLFFSFPLLFFTLSIKSEKTANEGGTFISQYGRKERNPSTSQGGFATLV